MTQCYWSAPRSKRWKTQLKKYRSFLSDVKIYRDRVLDDPKSTNTRLAELDQLESYYNKKIDKLAKHDL